jgi:predicted nucleic acid-binding protein
VTGWLLDTNILSELRRPKPEHKVLAFVAAQPLDLLYVSSATIAEIRFGIELVGDANRRAELNDWLTHKVRPLCSLSPRQPRRQRTCGDFNCT